MLLIDTSVWIDFIGGHKTTAVSRLRANLERGVMPGLTSGIYQEILQGTDSEETFNEFAAYFATQRFFHPRDGVSSFAQAARIYFDCRRRGYTVRSTADCLIAQIAIEDDVALLHDDRDFERIAEIAPKLKLA